MKAPIAPTRSSEEEESQRNNHRAAVRNKIDDIMTVEVTAGTLGRQKVLRKTRDKNTNFTTGSKESL